MILDSGLLFLGHAVFNYLGLLARNSHPRTCALNGSNQ